MRAFSGVVLLALACSSSRTSGERDAAPAGEAGPSLCSQLCTLVSRIPCDDRNAVCERDCEIVLNHARCSTEARTYFRCRLAAGEAGHVCEGGKTLLRRGLCETEESTFIRCIRM